MSPTIYNLDDWLWDTIPNKDLICEEALVNISLSQAEPQGNHGP